MKFIKLALFTIGIMHLGQNSIQAQVQTKFFRPSMTTTYIKSSSNEVSKIYSGFKNTPMEARFDHRIVNNNTLNITLPKMTELPANDNPLGMKKALADYKKAKEEWSSQVSKTIVTSLAPIGRNVFGDMLSRDADGNMSYDNIMKAVAYSATDNQVLSANGSKNAANIQEEIAAELLKRAYVVVYDVNSVKTYEQVYNERDAAGQALAAKTGKAYTPAKRTQEGWQIDFNYYIYKLVWNDSIQNIFGNDAWLDASITDPSERAKRKSAFENFAFPFEMACSGSSIALASQSNNAEMYAKLKMTRKTMDELLTELPASMQDEMVSKGGRKIEDFKMRAPIFEEYPLTVKLGKKEGLYYDERFFAYEMVQDKDGKQVKKRRGVLRASKIVDNAVASTGQSPASTFRQEGGKYLYQGTLVELKEDIGLGFNVGYGLLDPLVGGVTVGAEIRIPRFLKGSAGYNKYLRGLYLNANISFGSFANQELRLEDASFYYTLEKTSGSTMAYGASLSRETYIFKKGNIYLMPEIGAGLYSATVSKLNEEGAEPEGGLNIGSLYVNGGLGIGVHFTPMISLFAKASFNMKIGEPSLTDDSGTDYDGLLSAEQSASSIFSKTRGFSTPVSAGLRFRF